MNEEKIVSHERILICIALVLCAIMIGYNAFFVPTISTPTVIYTDAKTDGVIDKNNLEGNEDQIGLDEDNNSIKDSNSKIDNNKININLATEEELIESLTGVGEVLAERIVEYRQQNNGFNSIDEIMNVNGIGQAKFEEIKDDIYV